MIRIFALLPVALLVNSPVAGVAATNAKPEECIRSFYHWYVTGLIANREPLKERAEMKRFATERLLKEIDKKQKSADGLGSDYFVDAQDFDNLWAKNIIVSNLKVSGESATAHVLLAGKGEMRRQLKVWLVNDAGSWKIDRVQGRD